MILIADDHPDSANHLVRLLRHAGYSAQAFPCGPDLLQALQTGPTPDLIVLDIMMPAMSGIQCLQAIRANPSTANVPVVIYSADFTYTTLSEALDAGAQEFIVKGTTRWPQFREIVEKYAKAPVPQNLPKN